MEITTVNYSLVFAKTFDNKEITQIVNCGINFIGDLTIGQIVKMLDKLNNAFIKMSNLTISHNAIINEFVFINAVDHYALLHLDQPEIDPLIFTLTTIQNICFINCNNLSKIVLARSIQTISVVGCTAITRLNVLNEYSKITLDNSNVTNLIAPSIMLLNCIGNVRLNGNTKIECSNLTLQSCNFIYVIPNLLYNVKYLILFNCFVPSKYINSTLKGITFIECNLLDKVIICKNLEELFIDYLYYYNFATFNTCGRLRTLTLSNVNCIENIANCNLRSIKIMKCNYVELRNISVNDVTIDNESRFVSNSTCIRRLTTLV